MLYVLSKHFILYINSKHSICQACLYPFEGAVSKVFQCDFVTGFFIGGLTTRCVTPRVSPKGEKEDACVNAFIATRASVHIK